MEINNDYLEHSGVLGMKWGVRRYQNKDGTLTALGRKRAAKLAAKYNKLVGKKDSGENNTTNTKTSAKKKSIKDMTNEELSAAISRKKLENDYKEAYPTKQVKKGDSFVKKVGGILINDMVVPAATDIGKQVLRSYMAKGVNKALNLEGDSKVYANNKKKN